METLVSGIKPLSATYFQFFLHVPQLESKSFNNNDEGLLMMSIYDLADYKFNHSPTYSIGFTLNISENQYAISKNSFEAAKKRHEIINCFQKICLDIFKAALNGELPSAILHWLLNETPESVGLQYHRSLQDKHYTIPVFYRTDESSMGKLTEIQCPGSLWGELQFLHDYFCKKSCVGNQISPAVNFSKQLERFLGRKPIVHHLLDNASSPHGMRYFIEQTSQWIDYCFIKKGIKPRNCNFIRTHSFFGLCAENHFKERIEKAGDTIKFDFPPHVLFDQKATLVLPFWSLTRSLFSDDIRNILNYSTPLLPSGIAMQDGQTLSIEAFSNLPRSKRRYYLKYAGSDVSINWGSKAVYRLSNDSREKCLARLTNCLKNFDNGEIWLLQKEDVQNDEIEYYDKKTGKLHTENLRAKFSSFYGPYALIGILAMHRDHNKVHGQDGTAVISHIKPSD
jgi:hypothetical protein